MKLSIRDKKILLMFSGILLMALSYFFVYRPQLQEAQMLEEQSQSLTVRLNELLEMAKNKEFYVRETNEIQNRIQEYGEQFPSDVRPEDGIVLARNMENAVDIKISNLSLGQKEFVYSMDGTVPSETEEERETLSEQNNQATQEQINEIEGVQEEETTEVVNETQVVYAPSLYRSQDTMQIQCDYKNLKRAIQYIGEQTGRMTLDNLNLAFDSSTGTLTGNMTVNLFSMNGMNTEYTQPDAGKVSYGTKNIFGSMEKPEKKKTASKKKEAASSEEAQKQTKE